MNACMPSLEKFAVWLHIDKRGLKYLTFNTTPSTCICEVNCLCFIYMKTVSVQGIHLGRVINVLFH